jgi:2-polyprenyl-3-methyl-5-hydroxy-6-metoxy-1,4-benzoquinol methylase/organic radical activating enzyme
MKMLHFIKKTVKKIVRKNKDSYSAHWDKTYSGDKLPWDVEQHEEWLEELQAQGKLHGKILDSGCGPGRNALWLAKQGFDVVGSDISKAAIKRAKQKNKEKGLKAKFFRADMRNSTQRAKKFDTIIDIGCYHSINNAAERRSYIAGLHRMCNDNATIFLRAHNLLKYDDGRRIDRVGEEQIRADFTLPNFEILNIEKREVDLLTGGGKADALFVEIRLHKNRVRDLLRFQVDVTDHCNLNCKSCSHYCPITEPKFIDIQSFESDCRRISELTNRKIDLIDLCGGEPLLHPQIIDTMQIARKYFDGRIRLITNGTLLPVIPRHCVSCNDTESHPQSPDKKATEFWETCAANGIEIEISVYPVEINLKEIAETAQKYSVALHYRQEHSDKPKLWFHRAMDLAGKQNVRHNFEICGWGNTYIHLKDGKLYTCVRAAEADRFNAFFGQHFDLSGKNYIDIYKAKNIDEILKFLARPIPFCRYCRPQEEQIVEWGKSKKEKEEWI